MSQKRRKGGAKIPTKKNTTRLQTEEWYYFTETKLIHTTC